MYSGVTYPKHRVGACWYDERTRRRMPPIPLQRRRRSGFREFQDRHSNHCGKADERTKVAITVRLQYYQTKASTYVRTRVHAYRTVITPQITMVRSGVGDTRRRGRKGRDLERRNREKRLGCTYEKGVCRRDRRRGGRERTGGGGGGEETDGETCGGRERMRFERKRERGLLKITSYTLFQTDHLR